MTKNIVLIRNAQPYDFGGGERFPVLTASVLQDNGYTPTILSRSKALLDFSQQHSVPAIKSWWWAYQNWSGWRLVLTPVYFLWQIVLLFYYISVFIRLKPNTVHIQSKDDFIAATYAARLVGARVVWTDHADLKHVWLNVTVWYKNPIGKAVLLAARLAHAITVVSQSEYTLVTNNLKNNDLLKNKITVIYNGSFDYFTPHNAPESPVFIALSRLVKDKGIGELIEAFNSLKAPAAELWLLGDGNDRQTFESQAKNNPRVKFLGQQKNPHTFLSQASVFVHPTYHEGFSLALVEASMMELPIIATRVGGNPEIIKGGVTGLLVEPKNTADLSKAMQQLIDDPKLAQKLAQNARQQYLEKFKYETIVTEQFIPLYTGESAK